MGKDSTFCTPALLWGCFCAHCRAESSDLQRFCCDLGVQVLMPCQGKALSFCLHRKLLIPRHCSLLLQGRKVSHGASYWPEEICRDIACEGLCPDRGAPGNEGEVGQRALGFISMAENQLPEPAMDINTFLLWAIILGGRSAALSRTGIRQGDVCFIALTAITHYVDKAGEETGCVRREDGCSRFPSVCSGNHC